MTSTKVGKLRSNNEVNIQTFISCKCTTYLGVYLHRCANIRTVQLQKCSVFLK